MSFATAGPATALVAWAAACRRFGALRPVASLRRRDGCLHGARVSTADSPYPRHRCQSCRCHHMNCHSPTDIDLLVDNDQEADTLGVARRRTAAAAAAAGAAAEDEAAAGDTHCSGIPTVDAAAGLAADQIALGRSRNVHPDYAALRMARNFLAVAAGKS